MTITVSQTDAERTLPDLIGAAGKGETVVITRDGRPVAKLGPPDEEAPRSTSLEAVEALIAVRKLVRAEWQGPRVTLAEIKEWINEGRR